MRVQILMRLFLNPKNRAYLREMAAEFGASPGQLRDELGQLEGAGILESERVGRRVLYRANEKHALFPELSSMVRKALGVDCLVDCLIEHLDNLECAAVIDDYACGKDTGIIDLALLGDIDRGKLAELANGTEECLERKIRVLVFAANDRGRFNAILEEHPALRIW